MKIKQIEPPRIFETGRAEKIQIKDCARIALEPDEQVTFITAEGHEYDVARKSWGYYGTPSLNGRLLNQGLRALLAKSHVGKYYVFLVERGKETELAKYLEVEQNEIVRWLDNEQDLAACEGTDAAAPITAPRCMCGADRLTTAHMYWEAPAGEVGLKLPEGTPYRREVFVCGVCGHYVSVHAMVDERFYGGGYVDSTYGGDDGMRRTFEKIIELPPERSDNVARVARILGYGERHFGERAQKPSVLDVGSGLCVFLHEMKRAGWIGTALDPDPRASRHARDVVGVDAIEGDFNHVEASGTFDVITFNKVLEHVPDPIAMLARSREFLAPGGFVYVELPDGEEAARDGFHRQEFFLEHFHVFSMASIGLLAARAGYVVHELERLREPSSKYTLRAFITPRA